MQAPYTEGGIEKAAVSAVELKTKVLEPGEKQKPLPLPLIHSMASYDEDAVKKMEHRVHGYWMQVIIILQLEMVHMKH